MPFIEAAVESVLGQTRPADEIIVSDDASTDGTGAFLERRYAGRVKLVSTAGLPGKTVLVRQAASFARAFAHSTGDIVLLLDGDDLFLPQRIEHYAAALSDPSVVMVQSPLRQIDAHDRPLPPTPGKFGSPDNLLAEVYRHHDLDCFHSTSALGFRRAFLQRTLPLDLSDGLRVYPDDRLCIAALVAGRIITLPDESGCWRRHGRSLTVSLFRQRAYLARLAWDRARVFNRCRRGTALKPISPWRSGRFYLRWIRVLLHYGRR